MSHPLTDEKIKLKLWKQTFYVVMMKTLKCFTVKYFRIIILSTKDYLLTKLDKKT